MILLSIVIAILFVVDPARGVACSSYSSETTCSNNAKCTWWNQGASEYCRCASEVKVDIYFGIDISGSIGWTDFQKEKEWLENVVTQGIGEGARIGFNIFSSQTNISRNLTVWDQGDLLSYVRGIRWTGGWTNTPQLMRDAMFEFDVRGDDERSKIMIIITDGRPCMDQLNGGCPQSLCGFASTIKSEDIRVLFIGVGSGWDAEARGLVECVCKSQDDSISIDGFNAADFDSILGDLSEVLCPFSYDFKITEVKPEKNADCFRCDRFVEIWNSGTPFNASHLTLDGLIIGTAPANTPLITQSQYLVFYDKETGFVELTSQPDPGNGQVSCHVCSSLTCGFAASCNSAPGSDPGGPCYCQKAVYVECGSGAGCSETCCFNDNMDRSNWNIDITDDSGETVDSVTYSGSPPWITTDDGFAYELKTKGLDNDQPTNWGQSCSVYGTPGSDPASDCAASCTVGTCRSGGSTAAICTNGQCECDKETGYFPSCTGGACTTCQLIPEVMSCTVTWTKNGTDKYAMYTWEGDGGALNITYKLDYFSEAQGGMTLTATTKGELMKRIDDYYRGNTSIGGSVKTVVTQCFDKHNDGDIYCESYESASTWCEVHTSQPTESPTAAPTDSPIPEPTGVPTPAPTLPCPIYYFTQDSTYDPRICNPDRCVCANTTNWDCCISYDENDEKYHKSESNGDLYDYCRMDIQYEDGDREGDQIDGYLLAHTDHKFWVSIEPDDYPCNMTICWALEWDTVECDYDEGSDEKCDIEELGGMEIDVTEGCIDMEGADDIQNSVITFTVSGANGNKYKKVKINGFLKMINATSHCDPDCDDGRVYPMKIPVWYNSEAAAAVLPSNEEPIPAWIWWLVAAMAVFIGILAALIYKFWWSAKKTGKALVDTQDQLDHRIAEAEMGWPDGQAPDQAHFNPLATGAPQNNPVAGGGMPGGGDAGGGGNNFVRPMNEKFNVKQEFGPSQAFRG